MRAIWPALLTVLLPAAASALDGAPLAIVTTELPPVEAGEALSFALRAEGGAPPYTWGLAGGSHLPPGVELGPDGVLSGAPVLDGRYPFTVVVTDSVGAQASVALWFSVRASAFACLVFELDPPVLFGAARGQCFARGGSKPYVWRTVGTVQLRDGDGAGSLGPEPPPGVILAESGWISGTWDEAGTYLWRIAATDQAGAECDFTLLVDVPTAPGLEVMTRSLPTACAGVPYEAGCVARGGVGNATWTVTDGVLPEGLRLSEDGRIAGTPDRDALDGEASRTFAFGVLVSDQRGVTGTAVLGIEVRDCSPPSSHVRPHPRADGGCSSAAGGAEGVGIALAVLAACAARSRRDGRPARLTRWPPRPSTARAGTRHPGP